MLSDGGGRGVAGGCDMSFACDDDVVAAVAAAGNVYWRSPNGVEPIVDWFRRVGVECDLD